MRLFHRHWIHKLDSFVTDHQIIGAYNCRPSIEGQRAWVRGGSGRWRCRNRELGVSVGVSFQVPEAAKLFDQVVGQGGLFLIGRYAEFEQIVFPGA